MTDAEEFFERNLTFFKKINPPLAKLMLEHEPVSEVVYDDNGDPDLVFQGMKLYGQGAKKHAVEQIEAFWRDPDVVTFRNLENSPMDDEVTAFRDELLKFTQENDISVGKGRTTRQAFHLVVLGVGLGEHLESLFREVKPRNVILVEPNIEFIYQSMFFFDWAGILGELLEDDVKLHILTEKHTDDLLTEFRRIYSIYGRAFFDGLTVFRHYENASFHALRKFLAEEGNMLFNGLGFFEDELNMIANTYSNLKGGKERVFYADLNMKDIPIFIIGSGPSLDSAFDVIRANQDKAIIVSCGTALLPLMKAGIQPDFHVELERSADQANIPRLVAQTYDLSDIWLLGSTTLVPQVKEVFEKHIFYFRHMLSAYPAFSRNLFNCLRYPSPTVGNTGLSFAQDMGFREIYLFGVDMGHLDPFYHHASGTHYAPGEMAAEDKVPGNFGGEVFSPWAFKWSLDVLEVSIANSSMGYNYYNCSDGAFIKGSIPLLPEFVDLPEPPQPKKVMVEQIIQGFPVYSQQDFDKHWQSGELAGDVRQLGNQLIELIRNSDLRTKRYLSGIVSLMPPMADHSAAIQILRGSFNMMVMVGEYFLDRVKNQDKKAEFEAYVSDAYCRAVEAMCAETELEFGHLEEAGRLLNRETVWGTTIPDAD